MDRKINIEALLHNLSRLNVDMIENENNDEYIKEYKEYKSAYLKLRMFNEFDRNICEKALNNFKLHLQKHPYLNDDNRCLILDKIQTVNKQLEMVSEAA